MGKQRADPTSFEPLRLLYETHPLLAQRPPRYDGLARRDRRYADAHRPRGRGDRGPRRQIQRLRDRAGDRGGSASERGPVAGLHGGRGRRPGAGRLRRAQRANGHEKRVLAGRNLHPRQENHARQGNHPGRRVQRHALLASRTRAFRRSRRHHRSARRRARRRALREMGRPRRSRHRHQPDAQPPRRDGRRRDRAGSRGGGPGRAEDASPEAGRRRASIARYRVPLDFAPADAHLCPAFALRLVRGVHNGASPDWMQRRLRAIGLRPINALVDVTNYITFDRGRPLHVFDAAKVEGRPEGAARPRGRKRARARRQDLCARREHGGDRRRRRGRVDRGRSWAASIPAATRTRETC